MSVLEIVRSFMPDVAVFVTGLLVNLFLCILWRRRVVHKRSFLERQKEIPPTPDAVSLDTIDSPQEQLYYQNLAIEATNETKTNDTPKLKSESTQLQGDYDDIHGLFAASIATELPHMRLIKIFWMLLLVMLMASLYPSFVSVAYFLLAVIMITLYSTPIRIRSPHHIL
jgi:hypothetical protein